MQEIWTIGFEIPWNKNYVGYYENRSLSDFDIVIFWNRDVDIDKIIEWTPFITDISAKNFKKAIQHRKSEIDTFTRMGKNIYVMLWNKNEFSVELWRLRKGNVTRYSWELYDNFSFLPESFPIKNWTWKQIIIKDSRFNEYLNFCTWYLSYLDLQNEILERNSIFVSKDGLKTLWQIYPYNSWSIIFLPAIDFEKDDFIEDRDDGNQYRNEKGLQIWKKFLSFIAWINKILKDNSTKTPEPGRVTWNSDFLLSESVKLMDEIKKSKLKLETIYTKIKTLDEELSKSKLILDLLYEKGKPLEYAVRYALQTLWFNAEWYDDGVLELDQVITSPEWFRYIWECEWKDDKAIHIEKIRQLEESINRDFEKDNVNEKAKWIIFWNPQRLRPLEERNEDFSSKLLTAAKGDHIILIKTVDLFFAVKHILNTNDENYKKQCRDAISNCNWWVFFFPEIMKD